MKIFISHSSRQKLFVKELVKYIPEHINLWIDEKEILVGEYLGTKIHDTIKNKCDFVIIIIDNHAVKSKWVLDEFDWAYEREKELNRVFILPVVLEIDAWDQIVNPIIKDRRYLQCLDFTDESIKNFGHCLILELFSWLSKELDIKNNSENESTESIDLLKDADLFTAKIADQIRLLVYPYRRETPLEVEKLFESIKNNEEFSNLTFNQFFKLLERLQLQGYLSGIICNGFDIFVEEEHFAWKTAVHSNAKKRIARKAISYIKSGYTIAMDAGSTTLEVAKQIGNGLKMKAWKDLNIVTNSLSAANELLNVSSEMGWDDSNSLIRVYIIGGRIRPNTLAIVNDDLEFKYNFNDDFKNILTLLGKADISFVGCNGIHFDNGFSTHNNVEIYTKTDILSFSNRNFILSDPSKFGIKEEKVFASFENEYEIITVIDGFEDIIKSYQSFLEVKKTKIILA